MNFDKIFYFSDNFLDGAKFCATIIKSLIVKDAKGHQSRPHISQVHIKGQEYYRFKQKAVEN